MAKLRGYWTKYGYLGWVEKYKKEMLFASETEYKEFVEGL